MIIMKSIVTLFLLQKISDIFCYLRENKDSIKFKAVDIHVKQESVDFFKGAYSTQISNPTYIQHEMKVREVVPCIDETDVTSLPPGAVYNWVTRTMYPIMLRSMRPQTTGELEIINATLEDSGFYRCAVTSTTASIRLIFYRPIIVYGIPEYHLLRDLVFRANRMDRQLGRQINDMVYEGFCKKSHAGCIFSFKDKGFESKTGYYYLVEMKQVLDPNYRQPKCDPECIKQSALTYMVHGETRTQAFDQFRWKVVERIRTMTKFIYEDGADTSRIVGWCRDGFFLWRELICLPCLPGSYGWNQKCWQCDLISYQSHFASKSCRQCPGLGFSLDKGKTDPEECIPFNKNRIGQEFLILFTFVCFLLFWVFSLHCGLLPCIYKPDRNRGRPKFKDIQYLKVLEEHRRKSHQIKKLLKRAKQIENEYVDNFADNEILESSVHEMT